MFADFITHLEAFLVPIMGPKIDWKQVVLMGATPIFIIAFAIEYQVRKQRGPNHRMWQQFEFKDITTNLLLGGSYQIFEVIAYTLFTGAAVIWVYQYRLFDMPINGWTIVPLFIFMEFCYYWFHRTSHRVRWFWSAHVVHHSSEKMNMTTAMRQSLLYSLTGWWLFFMPMVLLGVHPAVVFFLYACDLTYQYFVHTESVRKLHPWIEYWFNTPSHHRVHHGRNDRYVDKNYGGVLICFDRWFGTFSEEQDDEPVDYGIIRQVRSNNILTLNTHEFVDMFKDVFKDKSLKHLWMPPEWKKS